MQINKIISDAIKPDISATQETSNPMQGSTPSFSGFLEKAVAGVNDEMLQASSLQEINAAGGPVDLHEVMIAGAKADVSFRMLLQVRNKVISAYEEVMRMQV